MDELNQIVAQNLIALRQKNKLTQLQVAEKINYSDKSISKWERGESLPDVSVLIQLASIYDVSLDEIVKKHDKKGFKTKSNKIKLHLAITTIAFLSVWLLATVAYTVLYGLYNQTASAWLSFIVAIPVSFLVAMILSFIWFPYYVSAILCSIFLWTTVLAITQCLNTVNISLLYIIAVPAQLIVILGFLIKKIHKFSFKTFFKKDKNK